MPTLAQSSSPLWTFQAFSNHRHKKPEALRGSSGIGKVREFADAKELRRRSDQRYDLCEEMHKQREVLRQREETVSTAQNIAAQAVEAARQSTLQREKTLIEEVDDWGAEYRSTKASMESAQLSASFAAEHQAALMHKQMDLPIAYSNVHIPQLRRNTVMKEMPQWYQEDDKNMPDWFELRKLLDQAEPLNLFQRSDSGSLTRFKLDQDRSRSTEPDFERATRNAQAKPFYKIPNDSDDAPRRANMRASFQEDRRAHGGGKSPKRQTSPALRELDGLTGFQLAKEMEKRDEEMLSRISQAAAAMSPTKLKRKGTAHKTLVSGSLMSPIDNFLARESLACTLPKQPPFGIETPQADPSQDPPACMCDEPVNPDKTEQFAWWSSHWATLTAPRPRGLEEVQVTKPKPIKPVRNFWKGNFQKRPVPWRKEQLGAFPSYKDFPWPPPVRTIAAKNADAALAKFKNDNIPWGDDRTKFFGASEQSIARLTYPADRTLRQCPDFSDKRSDLSNAMTTLPDGKAWRPRAVLGWAGYRQSRTDKQYDPFSRRMYADAVDKMLGITADKLVQCGVPPSAGNFLLAFAHFEPSLGTHADPIPKTGYLNWSQFQVALQHFGAVFTEQDERDLFEAFAITQPNGERKVHVLTFVEAIEERGLSHPLGFPYD